VFWIGKFGNFGRNFLLCAGSEVTSVVSLKNGRMQTLVTSSNCKQQLFGPVGAVFVNDVMLFSSQSDWTYKKEYLVHRIKFYSDFKTCLKRIGGLPEVGRVENVIRLHEEEKKVSALAKQNE